MEDFRKLNRDFLRASQSVSALSSVGLAKADYTMVARHIAEQCGKLRGAGAGTVPRGEVPREIAGAQLEELKRRVLRRA